MGRVQYALASPLTGPLHESVEHFGNGLEWETNVPEGARVTHTPVAQPGFSEENLKKGEMQ